jgi:RNA 3'-terminal phosphate cyclase-like protein
MKAAKGDFRTYRGACYFRYRLALATLTGTRVVVHDIRSEEVNPGLTDYEVSFMRLLQKVTSGSVVTISKTGTEIRYTPGMITNNNGEPFTHDCHVSRAISYYLEGIMPVMLFGKVSAEMTLEGVTNDAIDASLDSFRAVLPALLGHFGIEESPAINIMERGLGPLGGGKVAVRCPIVKQLEAPNLTEEGKVRRLRGVVYACKTSPQLCNRAVETMRGIFVDYIPDVWIHTDHSKAGLYGRLNPFES